MGVDICLGRLWPPSLGFSLRLSGLVGGHHFCCCRRPFLHCSQNTKWLTLHTLMLHMPCFPHSLSLALPMGFLCLCPSLISHSRKGFGVQSAPSAASRGLTGGNPLHAMIPWSAAEHNCSVASRLGEIILRPSFERYKIYIWSR